MTSREECEKAYLYLLKHCYEATKKNDTYDFAPSGFKESEVFKQLIEEHFEPKENTSEFKHFKLHSDSTLKNLTKVELIDYIKMLYHNWGITDDQLKNCIDANTKLKGKYSKILDDVHDYRYETHCMKMTVINLCEHFGVKSEKELQNIYLNKPYKFEDLKEDMWVYDIKYDEFCRIDFIAGIYPHRSYSDGTCEDGAFEENRFFPVQCANWNGSER